jgi:hypothetical protein
MMATNVADLKRARGKSKARPVNTLWERLWGGQNYASCLQLADFSGVHRVLAPHRRTVAISSKNSHRVPSPTSSPMCVP